LKSMNIAAAAVLVFVSFTITSTDALANTQQPPEFYSKLVSSLAKTTVSYCTRRKVLPPTLHDHDDGIIAVATFAGGCFWGLELAYQREPGVLATCVGYTQGQSEYPSYPQVCSEATGHTEAVLVTYDPNVVTYAKLADLLFDRIPDPTMLNRVGRDRGTQYRTGMYVHSAEQLIDAQTAFDREDKTWFGRSVVTEVAPAQIFWPAEEEHQQYLEKGGRFGRAQTAIKGATDEIRCYG